MRGASLWSVARVGADDGGDRNVVLIIAVGATIPPRPNMAGARQRGMNARMSGVAGVADSADLCQWPEWPMFSMRADGGRWRELAGIGGIIFAVFAAISDSAYLGVADSADFWMADRNVCPTSGRNGRCSRVDEGE